jgi:hypothetical protein
MYGKLFSNMVKVILIDESPILCDGVDYKCNYILLHFNNSMTTLTEKTIVIPSHRVYQIEIIYGEKS